MSEYDEEPLEPMPEPNRDPIKIAVETEISFGEVLDRIAYRALEAYCRSYSGANDGKAQLDNLIEKTVAKAIETRAKALVDERVEMAVTKLLTSGWTEPKKYDYDNAAPKHITLESFVLSMLTKVHEGDRYSDQIKGTLVERTLDKWVKSELAKLLAEELVEAKKKFKAAVDTLIDAKIVEAARAALTGGR